MLTTRDFAGGVFSADIAGGRAGATVSFDASAVLAATSDGQLYRVPFAGCQVECGGASGRMWFCRTSDRSLTIFCEAPGFFEALSTAARRELGPELDRLRALQSAQHRRSLWLWAAALLALLSTVFLGYLGVRHAARSSIGLLPRAVDEQLGELTLNNMSLGGPVLTHPVLTGALDEIVKRLAQSGTHGFKFRVRIVDAPTVNAFALPGGFIVVYTGLLRTAETPEQVAGVLAHEMAHVTRRHGMQRIAQSVGVIALIQVLFGDVSGLAAVAVEVLREGTINSYSRDDEHQADMDGVERLTRASVDPRALSDFFKAMQKEHAGAPQLPDFLASHPDLTQRIASVEAQAKRSAPSKSEPFALVWRDVQRQVGRAQKTWGE